MMQGTKTGLRSLAYVMLLFVLVSSSVVTIHEMSHALAAKMSGCSEIKSVIYDTGASSPYTMMFCNGMPNNLIITLAGLAVVVMFGLIFLIIDENVAVALACMIIGFGVLVSSSDLRQLGIGHWSIPLLLIGIFLTFWEIGILFIFKRMRDRNQIWRAE